MARIIGRIEPLIRLRNELNERNIYRFNSIRDINNFLRNFESEKLKSKINIEKEIDRQTEYLENTVRTNQKALQCKIEDVSKCYEAKIIENEQNIKLYTKKLNKNAINNFYYNSLIKILKRENAKVPIQLEKEISILSKKYDITNRPNVEQLINYTLNKENIVRIRLKKEIKELERIRVQLHDLNYLIVGAIGENLVIKEIEKLPDDFILINDFNLSFKPPIIYNKKPILSIQIDHLLISRKGVFILETKNWSKESVRNLDLRSPVEQIGRSSFVLFKVLNEAIESNQIRLNTHHWGERKVQIRNVIVMIHNKPNVSFKFVTIKKLEELNNYLNYFETIYDREEVDELYNFLSNI